MSRRGKWMLCCAGLALIAVAVVLAWPVPDPLAGGERVYIRWGFTLLPEEWRGSISAGIQGTVGDRHVTLVLDEYEADVVLELRSFSVSGGEGFLATGTGRAQLAFRAIDTRTGREHTVDMYVHATGWHLHEAELRTRRFWEFWK